MSETNKDIIRRYQDAYNRNDLDVLEEVLDPNWKTNGWPEVMPQTIESAKELYQVLLASFPDLSYETLDLIAEGDKVVQHWKMRGTFKGEIFGVPPTGELHVVPPSVEVSYSYPARPLPEVSVAPDAVTVTEAVLVHVSDPPVRVVGAAGAVRSSLAVLAAPAVPGVQAEALPARSTERTWTSVAPSAVTVVPFPTAPLDQDEPLLVEVRNS